MAEGLEFDPGFGEYIMAFQGTIEYLYADINRFKNLSQKKMRFRQYYKKILEVFYNNLGFYTGCLMWAAYIKEQDDQPILNNSCLNQEYDEEANTLETDFMIRFTELFPKDMKYFLSESFEFEPQVMKILNLYKEFLIINKGFVETKNSSDLKLPQGLKVESAKDFKQYIDDSISSKDLAKLLDYKDYIV